MTVDKTVAKVIVGNQISKAFSITSGVRESDSLFTLFNLVLHKIEVSGTVVSKSKQVDYVVFADDIVLIGRNVSVLKICSVNWNWREDKLAWAYFLFFYLFTYTILSKRTKMKLNKTLDHPVVTYGAETWTLKSGRYF